MNLVKKIRGNEVQGMKSRQHILAREMSANWAQKLVFKLLYYYSNFWCQIDFVLECYQVSCRMVSIVIVFPSQEYSCKLCKEQIKKMSPLYHVRVQHNPRLRMTDVYPSKINQKNGMLHITSQRKKICMNERSLG